MRCFNRRAIPSGFFRTVFENRDIGNVFPLAPAGIGNGERELQSHAIPFRRDGQKLLLTIDGYQVSFAQAVKAGMIKVSKA